MVYTLYSLLPPLYVMILSTLYAIPYTLYPVLSLSLSLYIYIYSIRYTLHSILYTLYLLLSTLDSLLLRVASTAYTVYSIEYIPNIEYILESIEWRV